MTPDTGQHTASKIAPHKGLHIHLDPVGGAAGDMFIAAVLHALPNLVDRVLTDVRAVLPARIGHPLLAKHMASGLAARQFRLIPAEGSDLARNGQETTYRAMRDLLEAADLSPGTSTAACAILHCIATAEARVHDICMDDVHFHELADWDALMDVAAAGSICAALEGCSFSLASLPLGGGLVETAHGKLPVPAPATALILEGFHWHDDGIPGERVTPTGAAILAHLNPGPRKPGTLRATGSGAGTRTMPGLPNILRVSLFDTAPDDLSHDSVIQLSCDIDDMTGEELGAAADAIRSETGVLDLILLTGQGKKSRPVTRLELIVDAEKAQNIAARVFDLTSTLGLRRSVVDRLVLRRELETMQDGLWRKRAHRPAGHETLKAESDDLDGSVTLADRRLRRAHIETDEG